MSGINASEQTIQGYRLSPQQERLWLLGQGGEQAHYDARCVIRVEGALDPAVLKKAIQQVVQRHEILRTTLQGLPGMKFPVQVIAETGAISYEEQDLTAATPADQKSWSEAFLCATPDETNDSLLRFNLVKLGSARYELHLSLSACCSDRATLKNLVHEISRLYQACLRGEYRSDDVLLQYADFAEWQQTLLEDETGETGRAHWRKQADSVAAHLQRRLPFEHLPTEHISFTSKRLAVVVPQESVQRIDEMMKSHGVSGSVFLLACWCILLQRLTAQEDVLIGVACDGRTHEDMQGALGPFTKYVPVSIKVDSASRFSTFVLRLQQTVVEGQEWQEYFTWKDIQEVEKDLGEKHFPFCFEFDEQLPIDPVATPAFLIEYSRSFIDRFKVRFVCERKGDIIDAALEYDAVLYSDDVIACFAEQLATLVSHAACEPEMSICHMDMLSVVERHRMLSTFNESGSVDGQNQCLHHLFETQVKFTPDSVAVVYEEQTLTYHELNRRADQLAHYLRNRGVGPETAVGICMERSPELIVGLLAILKSGGAYVPIDPSYPKDRIVYMLEDSRAPLLLTQRRFRDDLAGTSADVVNLDGEPHIFERDCGHPSLVPETPDRVAYIIYTSGSTGHPKGVLVSHRNAVHSTLARHSYYNDPVSRFLLLSSVAFDSSIAGIFWTLSQGGRLCLIREGLQKNPADIGDVIVRERVTHALCLPSLYSSLLEHVSTQRLRSLHTVIVAGETCPRELVVRHHAQMPMVRLFNEYGPTEGTVWSSVYQSRLSDEGMTVPIGRPIDGIKIYLLDPQLRPVAIGMPGELHIAGAGLARGYHNRADLTSEKFIPDPFSSTNGGRLYRTGDLARYRPDGQIEFIGRRDQQVKLRGYRIELGEIEAQLLEYREIQEAVVLARENGSGEKQLIAYLVSKNAMPDAVAIKEFLRTRLPEYMIPSAIVFLNALPLTPNGKLDRHALPAPDVSGQLAHQYVAPRTPTEELLTGMWADLLQVPRVGIHDNFFDLGGHSLLATQVMARVRSVFRVELPLRTLFEATTVAQLAEAIESAHLQAGGMEVPPVSRVERDGPVPLSFAQQRLWVLAQLEPGSPSYNIPIALRVAGSLDVPALEKSFNEVVRRHDVLRTTFVAVDGQPRQVTAPKVEIPLRVIDLEHLPQGEREATALRLATAEAKRPFELAYGPMLRTSLLRLSEDEHVLLVTLHHIVSDGWSAGILVRELTTLYENYMAGRPSPLPELSIQYADFASWQRQWLSGDRLETQLAYWKTALGNSPQPVELPTDYPRPAIQSSRGASVTAKFPPDLSEGIKAFSRRQGATLFMTALSGFYVLLFRYTGQLDLIVGSPIANRTRRETEDLIGFFVNTLALRVELHGNPTVGEVIERVRVACLGAYTHQDLPFERLVEELQPVRDVSRSPLFQVMFDMQNVLTPEAGIRGLHFAPLEIENQTSKFDLTLTVQDTEEGLIGAIEYNTDLFEETTMQRMLRHFQKLLEGMITGPEMRISELPLLSMAEQQLLVDWNNTKDEYPQGMCLHKLIEVQADKTPDAVAIVCGKQSLTYHELNRRANQLAHYLRQHGVGPDVLVGVCMERSVEMVVSLLGILKAGGAYLPIDPDYPQDRIEFMLKDTQPVLLLTQRHLFAQFQGYSGYALYLDTDWPLIAHQSTMNPQVSLSPLNLAYTIYTSGSTGRPKGVGNTHLGLLNRLQWMQDFFHLRTGDRVLQKTPFSFDVSVWEFFWPLMTGAGLVVAGPGEHRNPARLIELIKEHNVTTIHFVPPMLHVFLETAGVDTCRCLQRVICSGEALSAELQRRFFMQLTWAELHNLYGPTEAAIDVTAWICKRNDDATSVPIGRPIANTQIFLLDRQDQTVPIGVPGELHIGGVGVARGYHRRPALTAEKFVPDPFSKIPGSRIYKTGDVARNREDGVIEYIGRLDHQVKVRGFRVELGEIEAWLSKHSAVREVVVVAREDQPDDKRLVAYIVPVSMPSRLTPTANDLRQFLSKQLPEYMIPAKFLFLPELPRTANGKIDRKLLPAPDFSAQLIDQYVAPRTVIENKLAGMWAEVLNVERIGIYDNFFDLGGHSLLAVQLMSRIRKSIGGSLSLLAIFQAPTVASLAELLSNSRHDSSSSLVAFRDTGSCLPLYCFDPDGAHVLAYQPLGYSLDDEQPVFGISLSRILSLDWRRLSIASIAEDHVCLIRQHQPEGPYNLLGWSNGGIIALAVAHALERQDQAVSFLGILDTQPRVGMTENLNVLDELFAYVSRDHQCEFLSLPEEERQALQTQLVSLTEENRVEYAIQWAQKRGFLSHEESETSIDVLKIGYALDKEANRALQAYRHMPVRAPIHAWWASATLSKHGTAPVDWTLYTRGTVEIETILGDHTDAVQSIQVHQRISEILAMNRSVT